MKNKKITEEIFDRVLGKRDGSIRHGIALGRLNRLKSHCSNINVKGVPAYLINDNVLYFFREKITARGDSVRFRFLAWSGKGEAMSCEVSRCKRYGSVLARFSKNI